MRSSFKQQQPRAAESGGIAALARAALGSKSLVLTGLMGAGKSAVGRRLAVRLDLPFADADSEIEQAASQTIDEIFTVHGEAYFRDGERRVIARLLEDGPKVLATGGGAFLNAATRQKIAATAISVWLRADIDVLMSRVQRRDNRPLLRRGDPREIMEKLMQERHPVYETADITVHSRDVTHEAVVSEIIEALARYLRLPAASD